MSHLNKRQREALDNYITGHYGEDQFKDERTNMDLETKHVYHGWIVIEKREGLVDRLYNEYVEPDGTRQRAFFTSIPEAIEWWDKRVGQAISLLPLPVGAYRVYTEAA